MTSARRISSLPTDSSSEGMATVEVTRAPVPIVDTPVESPISPAEEQQLREEKLAAIRRAIDAGAYDSDEILEKALRRMMETLEDD